MIPTNVTIHFVNGKQLNDRQYEDYLGSSSRREGYIAGLRKAKELYSSIHSGGCRILTLGDRCNCFLCLCDREIAN